MLVTQTNPLARRLVAALIALFAAMAAAAPAQAQFWQCAPFARMASGIDLYGNAGSWWAQAEGRFARGSRPEAGSVLVMKPHGRMRVGHVAVVSRIVSAREITVTHANWSRPGQVEQDVRVIDVSPAGDWSQVKVWYASIGDVGSTVYPAHGFVHAPRTAGAVQVAQADTGGAGLRAALR
jgi:surface antigen